MSSPSWTLAERNEWMRMAEDAGFTIINDSRPDATPYIEDDPVGVKFDDNKLRFDLVPPEAFSEVVRVIGHGAKKYGDRNWELGMGYGRIFAAAMRHLWLWWAGDEKIDKESGISHLAHAGCCILFLLQYELRGLGMDDRR